MKEATAIWINRLDDGYFCSGCGYKPLHNETGGLEFSKFCPNCGSEMIDVDDWLKGKKRKNK